MKDNLGTALSGLVPPDSLITPRRIIAWMILITCMAVMRFGVRALPKDSPVRIFVEGSTSLMRDAVSLPTMLSAPGPSTLRGS